MTTTQLHYLSIFLVVGTAWLVLAWLFVQFGTGGLLQGYARRTFQRCLKKAREAGAEKDFMETFNAIAFPGDSLDSIIQRWGASGIRRIYTSIIKCT